MAALITCEKILGEMTSLDKFVASQKAKNRNMDAVCSKQIDKFLVDISRCSDLSDATQADKLADAIGKFSTMWNEEQLTRLTDAITNRMLNATPSVRVCSKYTGDHQPLDTPVNVGV